MEIGGIRKHRRHRSQTGENLASGTGSHERVSLKHVVPCIYIGPKLISLVFLLMINMTTMMAKTVSVIIFTLTQLT